MSFEAYSPLVNFCLAWFTLYFASFYKIFPRCYSFLIAVRLSYFYSDTFFTAKFLALAHYTFFSLLTYIHAYIHHINLTFSLDPLILIYIWVQWPWLWPSYSFLSIRCSGFFLYFVLPFLLILGLGVWSGVSGFWIWVVVFWCCMATCHYKRKKNMVYQNDEMNHCTFFIDLVRQKYRGCSSISNLAPRTGETFKPCMITRQRREGHSREMIGLDDVGWIRDYRRLKNWR